MKNEIAAYSSVKGSLHCDKGIQNQDSYIVRTYSFGTIIVVADGLGSKRHSDLGSMAVCKAVCKAIQIWIQYKERDIRLLLPLIHSIWGLEIYPHRFNECATTCLFTLVFKNGDVFAGQLGDGDIILEIDSELSQVKRKDDEFTNLTSCMGSSPITDWVLKTYHFDKKIRVVMMTDGISETLIPEKKIEFVHHLWKRMISENSKENRNKIIFQMLNEWNANNAGDDRTLVVYEKN